MSATSVENLGHVAQTFSASASLCSVVRHALHVREDNDGSMTRGNADTSSAKWAR
jgi:hypothetical protein